MSRKGAVAWPILLPRLAEASGEDLVTERTVFLAEPTVQATHVTEKAGTMVGAAQKDMAREFGAKLAALSC